jgi:photosystem II stability/assembly factor-like uncharacterized protein
MKLNTTIANQYRTASFAVLTAFAIFACPALSFAAPPTTVYAGTGGGLLKSTDGGMTWTNISPAGGFQYNQVTSLAIDPVNTQTIYVGASGNLYKTTDGGTHWTEIDNGMPANPRSNFTSIVIDPTNTSTIYAASGGALQGTVYKSTNAGGNWTNIGAGIPLAPTCTGCTPSILSVNGLAIDPTNPKILYEVGTDGTETAKTTNGGNSWNALALGGNQTVAIDPANPNTVFFSGAFGITETTDGGNTFKQFLTPPQVGKILIVNGLAIDPSNPTTVYAGAGATIYKSTATPPAFNVFGAGLSDPNADMWAMAVDPANSQTVYAATSNGMYVSNNAGSTWTGPTTPASAHAAVAIAFEPNGVQGAVFQAAEDAATQLIDEVTSSPFGAFSCGLLDVLNNEIPLFVNWGVLSSAQGQALQAQIQPVLSAAPCK